jgi:hypothetical protein
LALLIAVVDMSWVESKGSVRNVDFDLNLKNITDEESRQECVYMRWGLKTFYYILSATNIQPGLA